MHIERGGGGSAGNWTNEEREALVKWNGNSQTAGEYSAFLHFLIHVLQANLPYTSTVKFSAPAPAAVVISTR